MLPGEYGSQPLDDEGLFPPRTHATWLSPDPDPASRMMDRRPASNWFWTSALILAFAAPGFRGAEADTITYSTQGNIWPWSGDGIATPGIVGTNIISFEGITDGTAQAPGVFSLGNFKLAPLADGVSTTYQDTAFTVELTTNLGGNVAASPTVTPYSRLMIEGVLNGTVTGGGQSDVVATIRSISPDMLSAAVVGQPVPVLDLPFPLSSLSVVGPVVLAASLAGGSTPLLAQITPVPEPSTLAFSAAAVAGFAWIRRPRARRPGRAVVARPPLA